MFLNSCISFCCNSCHFAAVYALKPLVLIQKGGGGLEGGDFERGGGKSPVSPPPPPLYESLRVRSELQALPSKNELARSCKIVQESCKNLACKTCLARARDVPFLARFLHNLAPILARSCKKCARNASNYSCINSCKILHHFLQDMCEIVQESCKKRPRKGHIACTHVPSKSCMQDSCKILA